MAFRLGECLLRDRLKKRRMSQTQLAKKLGITKQMVNAYVTGDRVMSLEVAINAAYILECSVNDFYVLEQYRVQA